MPALVVILAFLEFLLLLPFCITTESFLLYLFYLLLKVLGGRCGECLLL